MRVPACRGAAVRRAAPKLVNSISRAVNLCETTLAFGKAEEPAPTLSRFNLAQLAAEVIEADLVISFKVFRERFGSRVVLWPADPETGALKIDTGDAEKVARGLIEAHGALPVPLKLRNAVTKLMKQEGRCSHRRK